MFDLVLRKMLLFLEMDIVNRLEIFFYVGCVLMVQLVFCCFMYGQGYLMVGFWDNYCVLIKRIDELFGMFKQYFNVIVICEDLVVFSLYLNL